MRQVLQPLEVGYGHAARIGVYIRDDKDSLFLKNRLPLWGGWTVGRFENNLCFDSGSVFRRNLVFKGGGDQDVAFRFQNIVASGQVRGPGRIENRPCLFLMLEHLIFIETAGIQNCAFALRYRHDGRPTLAAELGGVIPYVSKALNRNTLSLKARSQPQGFHVVLLCARLPESVKHAATCGLSPSTDSSLRDRFAGDTGQGVKVAGVDGHVGIRNPGHFSFSRAVIRGRHVDARAYAVLLDQLMSVAPRDALHLLRGVFASIDLHRTLGSAKRHIDDRALVSHESRKSHDFVFVGVRAEANPPLDRQLVVAVLDAPRRNDLHAAVRIPKGELKVVNAVAILDLIQKTLGETGQRGGVIKVAEHVFKETLVGCRHCKLLSGPRFCHIPGTEPKQRT